MFQDFLGFWVTTETLKSQNPWWHEVNMPLEHRPVQLCQANQFQLDFLPGTWPENGWFWIIFILHHLIALAQGDF